jgi:hypothetical protein
MPPFVLNHHSFLSSIFQQHTKTAGRIRTDNRWFTKPELYHRRLDGLSQNWKDHLSQISLSGRARFQAVRPAFELRRRKTLITKNKNKKPTRRNNPFVRPFGKGE